MNTYLHRCLCSLLCILLMPFVVYAQESYPIAFDRDANRTRTDRVLNGIVLNGNAFQVKTPMKMYHDMTDQTFYAHAGDLVSPSLAFSSETGHCTIVLSFILMVRGTVRACCQLWSMVCLLS